MSSAQTRMQARRNTLLAQAAAVVLAGVAVAAVIVGLPGVSAPPADLRTVNEILTEREAERERLESTRIVEEGAPARLVDLQAVAERLEVVHRAQTPEPPVVEQTIGPVTNGDQKVEVKYLGHIEEPNRRLALVSLNGRQRIIPAGTTTSFTPEGGQPVSIRVVGVSDSAVEYELEGERHRADKAPRVAGSVTKIAGTPAAAPGAGAAPQNDQGEESDIDRRRREAMERRQRILEEQERRGGRGPGRDDGEN